MDIFDDLVFEPVGAGFGGSEKILYRTASIDEQTLYHRTRQRILDRHKGRKGLRERAVEELGWDEEEVDALLAKDVKDFPEGEEGDEARREYLKKQGEYLSLRSVEDLMEVDDDKHLIDLCLKCILGIESFTAGGITLDWDDTSCWEQLCKKARLEQASEVAGKTFFLRKLGTGQEGRNNLEMLAMKILTGLTEDEGND